MLIYSLWKQDHILGQWSLASNELGPARSLEGMGGGAAISYMLAGQWAPSPWQL